MYVGGSPGAMEDSFQRYYRESCCGPTAPLAFRVARERAGPHDPRRTTIPLQVPYDHRVQIPPLSTNKQNAYRNRQVATALSETALSETALSETFPTGPCPTVPSLALSETGLLWHRRRRHCLDKPLWPRPVVAVTRQRPNLWLDRGISSRAENPLGPHDPAMDGQLSAESIKYPPRG